MFSKNFINNYSKDSSTDLSKPPVWISPSISSVFYIVLFKISKVFLISEHLLLFTTIYLRISRKNLLRIFFVTIFKDQVGNFIKVTPGNPLKIITEIFLKIPEIIHPRFFYKSLECSRKFLKEFLPDCLLRFFFGTIPVPFANIYR